MKKDKSFTLQKLSEVLLTSREHIILEKNQRNLVQGELLSNITERQLQIVIKELYKSIYQYEPDKATFNFLKVKFIEFNLNEEKLIVFIKDIKSAESSAASKSTTSKLSKSNNTDNERSNASQTDVYDKYIAQKPDTKSLVMEKPQQIKEHFTECDADSDPVTTEKIIENIRNQPKCKFDRNKIDNDSQALSDFLKQRNDDLHDEDCKRGKKYYNADDDLVLFPEFKWEVPQRRPPVCYSKGNNYQPLADQTALIGTLLEDAKDTQVGSIMPKFNHTEEVQYCPKDKHKTS
jgi:hypothetical protein